jgi:hypothetical protein
MRSLVPERVGTSGTARYCRSVGLHRSCSILVASALSLGACGRLEYGQGLGSETGSGADARALLDAVVGSDGGIGIDGGRDSALEIDAGAGLDSGSRAGCDGTEIEGPLTSDLRDGRPIWVETYETPPCDLAFGPAGLVITPGSSSENAYSGATSPVDDHRRRRVAVEIASMVDTTTEAQAFLFVSTLGGSESVSVEQHVGEIKATALLPAGERVVLASAPYDAAAHRWWQLRESGGVLHFEVSPDGVMWTELTTLPTPGFFVDDNAQIQLAAGTYSFIPGSLGSVTFTRVLDCLTPE